jgi:hypothetical protein
MSEEKAPEAVQTFFANCPCCKKKVIVVVMASEISGSLFYTSQRVSKFSLVEVPT